MDMSAQLAAPHKWRFFRAGGFDQVLLDRGADLAALGQLDQKLWMALSCPIRGLELDSRTLELIDTGNDGVIRAPEIIAAVDWAVRMLKQPDDLCKPGASLPLAAINDSTPEGRQLLASARQILVNLGKGGATEINVEDAADTVKIFASTVFNGDGVVSPAATEQSALQQVMQDIIGCLGAVVDRSGKDGVSQARVDAFFSALNAYADWWAKAEADAARILPFGDGTSAAAEAFHKIKDKVNDYFTRCQLAAYDARAANYLSPAEKDYVQLATHMLSSGAGEVSEFPLARVEAGGDLPLTIGVNPAWASAVAVLKSQIVTPLFGEQDKLSDANWRKISSMFAGYDAWQAAKVGAEVERLGIARVREILAGDAQAAIGELIARDKALEPEANNIAAVEKLARLHRDLFTLLNNYVSFSDFYSRRNKVVFQAGTLYIDGRSCDLCIRVEDPAKHATLATLSRIYLAYCDCTRRGSDEKMTIAAAITGGDADQLMAGRNGLFYDRQGRDWDATIVKIIEHPISVRQAFWSPYRRIGRMVSEQIEKFAASKEKAMQDKAAASVGEAGAKLEEGKAAPAAPPFDVGKFAGIFAAIGLAIGAIGTAIASVVTGLLGLQWWQIPLALAGVLLAISGPSMIMAYLKLRQRNFGPILDANGWAVNSRAMINIPFGGSLTKLAALPKGASRRLDDPFAEKKRPWKLYLFLLVLLITGAVLWQQGYVEKWMDRYHKPSAGAPTASEQVVEPAAAPVEGEAVK
ncbi:MAG: hypothetical protein L0Z73_10340 [Gammaproteobacteria bacterium]|nr:hypothetical protein [Gammaproteobacteria bacterium]